LLTSSPYAPCSILDKSSGKGAVGIWTHNLSAIGPVLNYSSPASTNAVLCLGPDVQGSAAAAAAHRLGYRVVTGNCLTVGVAGSDAQGGGYSALLPLHCLAVDNVLEWDVVLANGSRVLTPPTHNADLYCMRSGGVGSIFAAAVSVTASMHCDHHNHHHHRNNNNTDPSGGGGTGTGGALPVIAAASTTSTDAFLGRCRRRSRQRGRLPPTWTPAC
jgi:hypothetical protein